MFIRLLCYFGGGEVCRLVQNTLYQNYRDIMRSERTQKALSECDSSEFFSADCLSYQQNTLCRLHCNLLYFSLRETLIKSLVHIALLLRFFCGEILNLWLTNPCRHNIPLTGFDTLT